MKTHRTIVSRARTTKGLARAYIKQYGLPTSKEWSAGRHGPKRAFDAICVGDGVYQLTATSLVDGRPAGVIYGPVFAITTKGGHHDTNRGRRARKSAVD